MSIVKTIRRESPYAQIDNRILNNPELSLKAKGLLCYLLSKPHDWTVQVNDLIKKNKDGRDAVYSTLKELKEAGYVLTAPYIKPNNMPGILYSVYEEPQTLQAAPNTAKPDTGKPFTAKPFTGNPEHSNTNTFTNTEVITNKENIDVFSSFISTFNSITKKRHRVLCDKAKRQIKQLHHNGYTAEEIEKAIACATRSEYHVNTAFSYLTPEFISRPDKFELYLNSSTNGKSNTANSAAHTSKGKSAHSGGKKEFD